MIFGATSRNINALTLTTFIVGVAGILNFGMFTWYNLCLTIMSFYALNIIGVWMTFHRYYAHRSFEFKSNIVKFLCTVLALLSGRGSVISWTYLHRLHHRHADTESDPHSPKYLGFVCFEFSHFQKQEQESMKIFLIKDIMNKVNVTVHKYYMLLIIIFMIGFACIDIETFYFAWILPMLLIQLTMSNFNFFGHVAGYRNFETKDNSKNNWWLFPVLFGEAWHNNHHHNSKMPNTRVKKFELDPLFYFIELIKK